jgi:hypothetical protein
MPVTEFWKDADTVSSILAHVVVLAGAIAASVKFRVFRSWTRRHKSELSSCRDYPLDSGKGRVLCGEYAVYNIGERPIDLSSVTIRLCKAIEGEGGCLDADLRSELATRVCTPNRARSFPIRAGERIIFNFYWKLSSLDELVFIVCEFAWQHGEPRLPFIELYRARRDSERSDALLSTS